MQVKQFKGQKDFEVADFKAVAENGQVKISGYANNKGIADRYGDIPTPFNRTYVYDIGEYLKNPVLMLNHNSGVGSIAGKVTNIQEDERGLYFEAVLSTSDLPEVKHARTLIEEGMLKTVSIGGIWLYEDAQNPTHLTLAKIFEISLVAIPADPYAVFEPAKSAPKQAPQPADALPLVNRLRVYEINQKLKQFVAKINQPEHGQGANK